MVEDKIPAKPEDRDPALDEKNGMLEEQGRSHRGERQGADGKRTC
uniref:Uncharacterized protein n=1 Tax=Candidatus Kentrum sp. TC TaxID=2126339 RepID=A0A450Y908_9GAMM|nr:MAG: hypothetical protein BECKTC1821D_GA0114238_100315 [Candidatus Kentron sp. TC]VFK54656.1 MAG: hypothetical protein BECKTC1821F_GA0114240_100591 [Candidatus Kentron sp. TC]